MHDPMTVVFDIRRPPLTLRELRGRKAHRSAEPDRLYRHRQIGFLDIRAPRFRCAHCDDGRVKQDVPSYHAHDGYRPGEPCPDCRGRGYNAVSWTCRLYWSFAFFRLAGREWYLPSLVTVWHVDPEKPTSGRSDDSCRNDVRRRQLDAHKDDRRLEDRILWWRYRHMHKWHLHHWKIQVRPVQTLRRWLFTRCAGCGERLPYGYSPVSVHWDKVPHRWNESEVGVYHHECYVAARLSFRGEAEQPSCAAIGTRRRARCSASTPSREPVCTCGHDLREHVDTPRGWICVSGDGAYICPCEDFREARAT